MLVVELRLTSAGEFDVVCRNRVRDLFRINVVDGLAQYLVAREAEMCLAGAVDHDVAEIACVLDDDGGRHVFDDGGGESLRTIALLLGLAALGDVFMRDHPTVAVCGRLTMDRDSP